MMSRRASRFAAAAGGLAAAMALAVAAAPASAAPIVIPLKNFAVYGSLTPKKLNEPVVLPKGSAFNGAVSLTSFIPFEEGTVSGKLTVPPFTASLKLVGLVPTNVGVTITEVGEAEGTIVPAPFSECEKTTRVGFTCTTLSVSTKANIGLTAAGVLGISVPTHCVTSEPVLLALSTHLTEAELLQEAHFTGTVTIPPITCEGIEGLALGALLTAVMSGPENPYKLGLAPHEPTPPAIEPLPTTSVTQVSAKVHSNASPSGEPITECRFEYGTSTEYGTSVPCPPEPRAAEVSAHVGGNAHTLRLTGLAEGTTYHYRLAAVNSLGTGYGADSTFTTLPRTGEAEFGQCVAQKKTGQYANGGCTAKPKPKKAGKGNFEWKPGPAPTCFAKTKGEYTNSSCSVKSAKPKKGSFEKQAGPKFTSSSGALTLEVGGHKVTCAAGTGSGEVATAITAPERITFTGCEMSGKKCTSEGTDSTPSGSAGTIETNLLTSRLLGPVEGQVWTELSSAEHEPYLAELGCEGVQLRVKGYVSGVQSGDVGAPSATGNTSFGAGEGEQVLEGEVSENGGSSWSAGGATTAALALTSTFELPTEIKP